MQKNGELEVNNLTKTVSVKDAQTGDEKLCDNCGLKIKKDVVVCPYYKEEGKVKKPLLVLLALLLGGIGLHKFYVGKHWQGFLYVLFCWTGIPSLVSLFEAIIYIFLTEDQLNKKYSVCSNPMNIVTLAMIVWIIIFGSIALVVAPKYVSYWECAQQLFFSFSNKDKILFPEGYQEFSDGNYDKAYQLFEESLSLTSATEASIIPLYMMGQCFYEQGEYDQAIIQYQKVIANFPKNPQAAKALLRQAQAFEKMSDYKTSAIIYRKIISSYETLPEADVARRNLSLAR